MPRAWFFQANPEQFDIDGALEALSELRWRTPQHASEIRLGDVAVIWRAGSKAGIVAVGRIASGPAEMAVTEDERSFNRSDLKDRNETRALIILTPCPLIPKSKVEALEELSGHQLLIAPRTTVYPIAEEQWNALAPLLPPPPPAKTPDGPPLEPAVFAWEQRHKSVHPLPGGVAAVPQTLRRILEYVQDAEPERRDLDAWVSEEWTISATRSQYNTNFLQRISLLTSSGGRITLTPDAAHWLATNDPNFLLRLVHARVRFVGELLAALDQPRTTSQLLEIANQQYGANWQTGGQVQRRLMLLEGFGAVAHTDDGQIMLTPFGRLLLASLDLYRLVPPKKEAHAAEPDPPRAMHTEASADAAAIHRLTAALNDAASDSSHPDRFEHAIADTFRSLGFESTWYGGAGKTDVLLVAPLGPDDTFRVIVDAKTSAAEHGVQDQQIDWTTLDEHKAHYNADYVAVVAGLFHGSRVRTRAATRTPPVALIDVPTLGEIVEQHVRAPLGLEDYRVLFLPSDDALGAAVAEPATELRRQLVLTSELVRQVVELEASESRLTAKDLYWNLGGFEGEFERPSEQEIEEVLTALSSPGFGVLRRVAGGYRSLGSLDSSLRRLRLLAELIEHGAAEQADP